MVWLKSKIENEISKGRLVVGKNETERLHVDNIKFDNASMEVHLSNDFRLWRNTNDDVLDPTHTDFEYKDYYIKNTIPARLEEDGSYILKAGSFILCEIYEYIKLPENVFASIESKSKLARLGISVHNAAPSIHPGYDGHLTLEIINHSNRDILLRPYKDEKNRGLTIAQIFFEDTVDVKSIELSKWISWISTIGSNYDAIYEFLLKIADNIPSGIPLGELELKHQEQRHIMNEIKSMLSQHEQNIRRIGQC